MRVLHIVSTAFTLAGGIVAAHAHASLDHASPRVGSVVQSAPREVSLWFTEGLEPAFSRIEVYNSGGARVDQGKSQVDRADPKHLRVGLKSLAPGSYKVQWRVISVDTHKTEGSFTFEIKP